MLIIFNYFKIFSKLDCYFSVCFCKLVELILLKQQRQIIEIVKIGLMTLIGYYIWLFPIFLVGL